MKNLKQRVLVSCFFFFGGCYIPPLLAQQNVGIGTTTPDACAALEIRSTNQGLLIPRMSASDRVTIKNPAEGLMVFDSSAHIFYYYANASWNGLRASGQTPNDAVPKQSFLADTGNKNTFYGSKAGYTNTSERYNTFSGSMAGHGNNTGNYNTYSGYFAGYANARGSRNTGVGNSANSATTDNTNSTGIGYNADPMASNTVHIGNNSVTSIKGQVGFSTYGDARFKTEVSEEEVLGLAFITGLRPVTYTYNIDALAQWKEARYGEKDTSSWEGKYDIENIRFSGFIAQEVEALADRLGYAFSGVDRPKNKKDIYGLRYAAFVVPLVKAVQEQQARIQKLEARNRELNTELEAKQAVLDERLARVEGLLHARQKTEKQ